MPTINFMKQILILMFCVCSVFLANAEKIEWALYDVANGGEFHNGVAAIRTSNGYELMYKNGKVITNEHFHRIYGESLIHGYCRASNADKKDGIINLKGEWIFAPSEKYDIRDDGKGVFSIVDKETQKKALFHNGHLITPFKYRLIMEVSYPFFRCSSDEGDEVVNVKTEDVIKGRIDAMNTLYAIANVLNNDNTIAYLYYDLTSGERIPAKELLINDNKIGIDVDGLYFRIINTNTKTPISDLKYLYQGDVWINDRLIGYNSETDLTYIFNEKGQTIGTMPSIAQRNGPYAFYTVEGRYYDYNGNIIENAKSLFHIEDVWYKMDKKGGGSCLFNAKDHTIYPFTGQRIYEGMILGSLDGKNCYFNTETKRIVGPFNVINLPKFNEGVAVIDEAGNERLIDKSGKCILNFRERFRNISHIILGDSFSENVLSLWIGSDNGTEQGYIYNPISCVRNYSQSEGDEKFIGLLEQKARTAFNKKKYAEAQALFYQIFLLDNSHLTALNNYGACLYNQGFYSEAIEAIEMVLTLDPANDYAKKIMSDAVQLENMSRNATNQEFENVSNHNSVWNVLEYISNTLFQPYGNSSVQEYNSLSETISGDDLADRGNVIQTESNYQSQYDRWSSIAEKHYNSLTNLGYSYTNENDKKNGHSGRKTSPGKYTHMKRSLREAQREMRNIRQKARREGINIIQSEWETANVSY